MEALDTITFVAALTGLAQPELLILLDFALTVTGYALTGDAELDEYDVTLVYTKTAEIDGICELVAGRQVRMKSYIGDDDIILKEPYRDNAHEYYYLSNMNFAKKAVELM